MDFLLYLLPLQTSRMQRTRTNCEQDTKHEMQSHILFLLPTLVIRVVWPGNLSSDACSSFHRGGDLGVSLGEPWLVANAATYLSNYSQHLLEAGALSRLVPVFRPLLDSLTAATQLHTGSHDMSVIISIA